MLIEGIILGTTVLVSRAVSKFTAQQEVKKAEKRIIGACAQMLASQEVKQQEINDRLWSAVGNQEVRHEQLVEDLNLPPSGRRSA